MTETNISINQLILHRL